MQQEPITKIVAYLKVTSQSIKRRFTPEQQIPTEVEEVVEYKAFGLWDESEYPISIHITTFPGCGAIPLCGDRMKVTIERDAYRHMPPEVR